MGAQEERGSVVVGKVSGGGPAACLQGLRSGCGCTRESGRRVKGSDSASPAHIRTEKRERREGASLCPLSSSASPPPSPSPLPDPGSGSRLSTGVSCCLLSRTLRRTSARSPFSVPNFPQPSSPASLAVLRNASARITAAHSGSRNSALLPVSASESRNPTFMSCTVLSQNQRPHPRLTHVACQADAGARQSRPQLTVGEVGRWWLQNCRHRRACNGTDARQDAGSSARLIPLNETRANTRRDAGERAMWPQPWQAKKAASIARQSPGPRAAWTADGKWLGTRA